MTCCYLLSLPELPQAPQAKTSAKKSSLLSHGSLRKAYQDPSSKDHGEVYGAAPKDTLKPVHDPDQVASPIDTSHDSSATSLNEEKESQTDLPAADLEMVGIAEKLRSVFDLHTRQRMKPGTSKRGVSIPSQQRFVHYWSRMMTGQDVRPFKQQRPSRKARVESITVRLQVISQHHSHG